MPPAPARLLSFRRAFALLLLLVVLPSVGLSGFGIVAIVNERAAVEKRLAATWGARVEAVAERLASALLDAQVESTPEGLTVVASGVGLSVTPFRIARDAPEPADPLLRSALPQLAALA